MQHSMQGEILFKRIWSLFVVLGLSSIYVFIYGLSNIDNYHSWFSFIALALTTGLAAGILLTKAIYGLYPSIIGLKGPSSTPLMFAVCLSTMAWFTGLARFINESNVRQTICSNYSILETGHSSGSTKNTPSYYLFVNFNGKKERLSFPKAFAQQFKAGDSVALCLKKGNLGYYFFDPNYCKRTGRE